MNGRDGRYDSGDFDDADWLLSQLGSGRRPDLEGRTSPEQPPVVPEAVVPPAPVDPVSPPPATRARRRSEESLDWFSLAEPAGESDAATRALPVVGEPIQRHEPEPPQPASPSAPAWNQPAWSQPAHPAPPRVPAPPPGPDRLTSVEPPVGSPIPPAFGGQPAAPAPPPSPPGPVTPPASFALTWGDQPIESEEGLRAAFRRLSDPTDQAQRDEPQYGDAPEPRREQPEPPVPPTTPFEGFTPPPVARQSFTPVPPATPPAAFPPARSDFDDELWSALTEDQPAGDEPGRGADDAPDWRDGFGDRGRYDEYGHAPIDGGRADDARGFVPDLYAGANGFGDDEGRYDERAGYVERGGYDQRGAYDDRGGDASSDDRWDDEGGAAPWPPEWQDAEQQRSGADDVRWYADEVAERERGRQGDSFGDDRDPWEHEPGANRVEPARWEDEPADDGHGAAPWEREDNSPMARELAQTGYFWNLTPDPTGRDPKAESDDDEPGPRRRSGDDAGPEARPFGADTYASVERFGEPDLAAAAGDDADPFARFAQDEDDPYRTDDGYAAADAYAADAYSADPYAVDDRDDVYDDRDPFGERHDDRFEDRRHPAEPGTQTGDGLAALFGGAGFGATGPMGVVPGTASGRTAPAPDAQPDRFDPFDDPFGRDGFGRDDRVDDPYARDDRHDRYGDERTGRTGGGSGGGRPPQDAGGRSPVTVLAWIAGALAAVLLVVGGFALVSRMMGGGGSEQTASEAQDSVELPEPTAIQAPGVYPWSQLFGGECLDPFQDPWADEFTVVDCAAPHAAQLVLRGEVSTDAAAPFPGEAEVAAQVGQQCAAEGVIDPATLGDVTDLQMQASYPVTEEQWTSGERTFYCFVNRSSGEPLAVSVQGPGPQA
ncbi:MAG TPA: septum formation family protein [Agromyces sp.]|nr:septum formation family protein [Agromyces sp.]